jgi:hypothetical protein
MIRIILAILHALNPFGPASGDWHSIDTRSRDTDGSPQGPDRNGLDGEAATAGAEGIAK